MHFIIRALPYKICHHSTIIESDCTRISLRFIPIFRKCVKRHFSNGQWGHHQNNHHDDYPWWKIKLSDHKKVWKLTWTEYASTWEGFFDNLKTHKKDSSADNQEEHDDGQKKWQKNIQVLEEEFSKEAESAGDNFKKNIKTIVNEAKNTTNISSKDELMIFIGKQMKLANLCLTEFTAGYRKGRDEELERVANEYFQDLDRIDDVSKKESSSIDVDKLEKQIVEKVEHIQTKAWETVQNLLDSESETDGSGGKDKDKDQTKAISSGDVQKRSTGGSDGEDKDQTKAVSSGDVQKRSN